jgi:hypothetical protein
MGQNAACSENPKIVGMAGCLSLQIWYDNVCHPHIREWNHQPDSQMGQSA